MGKRKHFLSVIAMVLALCLLPSNVAQAAPMTYAEYVTSHGYFYTTLNDEEKKLYDITGQFYVNVGSRPYEMTDYVPNGGPKVSYLYQADHLLLDGRSSGHFDRKAINYAADCLAKANAMAAQVTGTTRRERVKQIHDMVCNMITYSEGATDRQYAYLALLNGKGTCDAYTKTFATLCHLCDVPCVRTMSQTHAWNIVQLDDGVWYEVDVTWDDQQYGIIYNCFLLSKQEMIDYSTYRGKTASRTSLRGGTYYDILYSLMPVANGTPTAIVNIVPGDGIDRGEWRWDNYDDEDGDDDDDDDESPVTPVPSKTKFTVGDFRYELHYNDTVAVTKYLGNKTDVVIPKTITDEGKTYTVDCIRPEVFMGNTSLKKVTIPESVTIIGNRAFQNAKNLKKVIFDGKTKLDNPGNDTFKGAGKNASKLVIKGLKGKTAIQNKYKSQNSKIKFK